MDFSLKMLRHAFTSERMEGNVKNKNCSREKRDIENGKQK